MKQQGTERLVSVIVPVYNCEKYIEKCLKSIVDQSYRKTEILVVNDGSNDASQEIIDKLAVADVRIHKMYQKNQGVAAARNYALSRAKGDYYLFVDGDDYIGINYIQDLVTCAVENQSELVICGYTLVYTDKNKTLSVMPRVYEKYEREEWAYRISSAWARLYSSEFWRNNDLKFIPEKDARAEDVPLDLYSNAMAKNICVINKSEYYYVHHRGSAMNSTKKVRFLFPYIAFEEMYNKVRDLETTNSRAFFDIGVLKFLAMFKYVIYRKADRNEKKKFKEYVCCLINSDLIRMRSEWKKLKKNIELPIAHKLAVSLFLTQMGNCIMDDVKRQRH